MQHVEELWNMNMSVQRISDITKRTWSTVKRIIDSGFNLDMYKTLRKSEKMNKTKKLTFKPFKESNTPGDTKAQKIPVKAVEDENFDPYGNDVLNYMYDLQQEQAKQLVKKAEQSEAIHKVRNGLQMISEGLGGLL